MPLTIDSSSDLAAINLPPLVSVGLPVFNGEEFIGAAIESLLSQTFTRWVLLVSDNGSQDHTVEIVAGYAARDERIRLVRQTENKGATANFHFVIENVHTPYFMWLAADDVLETTYVENCVSRLNTNHAIGMAFCGIRNIDRYGREVRAYPNLVKLSGSSNFRTVLRFLLSPEIMGKANLIYSVYRTEVCRSALRRSSFTTGWGTDMSFVLGALVTGGGIDIAPSVLFNKRYVRSTDTADKIDPILVPTNISEQSCPVEFYPEYMTAMLQAVQGTRFWPMAWLVLHGRHYQLRKIEERRLERLRPKPVKPAKPAEGPWMARLNRVLRKFKLKKSPQ